MMPYYFDPIGISETNKTPYRRNIANLVNQLHRRCKIVNIKYKRTEEIKERIFRTLEVYYYTEDVTIASCDNMISVLGEDFSVNITIDQYKTVEKKERK